MAAPQKWFAESLRLTVFIAASSPPSSTEIAKWWKRVAGRFPDESTTQTLGIHVHKGGFQNGTLVLQAQPGRIDWMLLPILKLDEPSLPPLPVLNYYNDAMDSFTGVLLDWIKHTSNIKRLALGSVAVMPVSTKREAYQLLDGKLGLKLDPDNSCDFLYQINRPRKTAVKGLKGNRLCKWSAAELSAQVSTPGDDAVSARHLAIACRVEIDINTFIGTYVPNRSWPKVYSTFKLWSKEIIKRGDVK